MRSPPNAQVRAGPSVDMQQAQMTTLSTTGITNTGDLCCEFENGEWCDLCCAVNHPLRGDFENGRIMGLAVRVFFFVADQ